MKKFFLALKRLVHKKIDAIPVVKRELKIGDPVRHTLTQWRGKVVAVRSRKGKRLVDVDCDNGRAVTDAAEREWYLHTRVSLS